MRATPAILVAAVTAIAAACVFDLPDVRSGPGGGGAGGAPSNSSTTSASTGSIVSTSSSTSSGASSSTSSSSTSGAGGAGGASSSSSSTTSGFPVAASSSSGGLAAGQPCMMDSDCHSGTCGQGFCCMGTCPVQAPESCGTNGHCDDTGACQDYPAHTPCETACLSNTEARVRYCNGQGACAPGASQIACAPYICSGGACLTACTADAQCATADYCDDPLCVPKGGVGASCSADDQCTTGDCVIPPGECE